MKITERKPGELLYLHYYIYFPVRPDEDEDYWVDCMTIAMDLESFLKNCKFVKEDPNRGRDLLVKGEASWKIEHGPTGGVVHRVVLSREPINKVWGSQKMKLKKAQEAYFEQVKREEEDKKRQSIN